MSLFPRLISASASPTQIQFYKNSPFFPLKIMRAVLPSAARPSLATSSQSLCLEELLKPRNYRCALVTPRSLASPWWHRAPFFFYFRFPIFCSVFRRFLWLPVFCEVMLISHLACRLYIAPFFPSFRARFSVFAFSLPPSLYFMTHPPPRHHPPPPPHPHYTLTHAHNHKP